MHISTFVLCDAATVREGLLNVLGGGVTFIRRPSYPAPLLCDIGLVVSHRGAVELGIKVTLRKDGQSQPLTEFELQGSTLPPAEAPANAHGSTSLSIDARALAIPSPGDYTFTVTIKGGKGQVVSFAAVEDVGAEQVVQVVS